MNSYNYQRFKKLLSPTKIKPKHLQDELKQVSKDKLKEMFQDNKLITLLTMTGEEMEKLNDNHLRKYLFLIKELTEDYKNTTLYDLIRDSGESMVFAKLYEKGYTFIFFRRSKDKSLLVCGVDYKP